MILERVGVAKRERLRLQRERDGDVWPKARERQRIRNLGVILRRVGDVGASSIVVLVSRGLLPLPEHGVDVLRIDEYNRFHQKNTTYSVMREECGVIRGRACKGEVLGVGEPACGAD